MRETIAPASRSRAAHSRLTTRSLLACAVLGAFTAVLIHLSRFLGLALAAGAPWLSFPAPLPWFLVIIAAALLVQRSGAALLTSFIGAVIGVGALSLCGGIVVEIVFLVARKLGAAPARVTAAERARLPRSSLVIALISGVLVAAMMFGFMFLYKEFLLIPAELKIAAAAVRVALGLVYGWLAYVLVNALLRVGVDPQGVVGHDWDGDPAEADDAPAGR